MIYDGGLPLNPSFPFHYPLLFNVDGLINEYDGFAYFLRGYEVEAFATSGGLSTMPWSYRGRICRLENKTLRYPGHCQFFPIYIFHEPICQLLEEKGLRSS
ncbi:hypothetical protein DRP53_01500 [candidate division WOR-3 bacterium]|uniref:Uncharacterized protein n=1 Tax=candidate division WOR-3 bacterium TaxID=2052148 RepID=A0A660SND2_UNCW3|nr:MAG: hypothetical protein DRP53_01500 [candidate division WOR-3 bacterium]